jgi:hypothetical protein
MLKEAIEKILSLAVPYREQVHGLPYADRKLVLVDPPQKHAAIALMTLTGLVDAVQAQVDGLDPEEWVFDVMGVDGVRMIARHTDSYGEREVLLQVNRMDGESFRFGQFQHREEFVIGLQSRFVQDEALATVLRLASTLEGSTVAVSEDDGISQRTTVKQGVALKQDVRVQGRVTLRPYRTFREVEQPASEFVFRLRSEQGQVPMCALFEADGGKWKLDAVLTIKAWLEAKNLNIPVIA